MRVAWLLPLLLSCEAQQEVRVLFADPGAREEAQSVQVAIISNCVAQGLGDAPVDAIRVMEVAPGEDAPALGDFEVGGYGLYARAVNDRCEVIAAGCTPVTLIAGAEVPVSVLLGPAARPLCGTSECWLQSCTPGDSGARDARVGDVGIADAGHDAQSDAMSGPDAQPVADGGSDAPADAGPDAADGSVGCVGEMNGADCDDQNICTPTSECRSGECVGTSGATTCLLADSRSDYGGIQGGGGWSYGYWNESLDMDGLYDPDVDFDALTHFDTGGRGRWRHTDWSDVPGDPNYTFAYIAAYWQHPAVRPWNVVLIRRWESTVNGPARVIVHRYESTSVNGDGTRLRVLVDGTEVWTDDQSPPPEGPTTASIDITLRAGMRIDFLHSSLDSEQDDIADVEFRIASPE